MARDRSGRTVPKVDIHAYRKRFPVFDRLPPKGLPRAEVLAQLREMKELEEARWKAGYASGAVYNGADEHVEFLNQAYALHSQSNPLHVDLWPSAVKFESEIVAMTARMLGAGSPGTEANSEGEIVGTVTSGGTESILLAMKTYRDFARDKRGIERPEMIVPTTAHAAFDKAAQYFGIRIHHVPIGPDWRADVQAMAAAINDNTIVMVGSAPPFPHGIVDPIAELSEIARQRGIGFHTDACLGGFILPWAERLGYPVPPFDFRLPGVTSISVDTHKFGYAAKGTSVVLYRGRELRRYQYFTATDWPGGLYCSPTFAGSRPGGLSAACWAAMVSFGEEGYLAATRRILETSAQIKAGIAEIPELTVLGDPLFVIAFTAKHIDIYKVLDAMTDRGWSLNGLQRPASLHLCVTLRHTEPGVAERFLADLRDSVEFVKAHPEVSGGQAPIYGMANTLPDRTFLAEAMKDYMDGWYKLG